MRVVRKGYERQSICTKCKSVLLYVSQDITLYNDMEGDSYYAVKCPECSTYIKVLD